MKKHYDVNIIQNIIYEYSKINTKTLIEPKQIYLFAMELFENKKIPYKLSYDFWRKEQYLGKKLVIRANKAYEYSLVNLDLENHGYEPEVIDNLTSELTLKKEIKRLMELVKNNEEQNKINKKKIENLNKQLIVSNNKINSYKRILFSLMSSSIYSEDSFFDVLNGSPIENKIVRNLLDIHLANDNSLEVELIEFMTDLLVKAQIKLNKTVTLKESKFSQALNLNKD